MTWVGQAGSTLAALAALLGVLCIATVEWRTQRVWWLALPLAGLALVTTLAPFFPPVGWLPGYCLLATTVLLVIAVRIVRMTASVAVRLALPLPLLAMLAATIHQAAPTLYTLLHWLGPPVWGLPIFRLGEGVGAAPDCRRRLRSPRPVGGC